MPYVFQRILGLAGPPGGPGKPAYAGNIMNQTGVKPLQFIYLRGPCASSAVAFRASRESGHLAELRAGRREGVRCRAGPGVWAAMNIFTLEDGMRTMFRG
jgi:hypothetical protein